MIQKMEHLGASKSVVGLVIPTGYSFFQPRRHQHLSTLATLFLAQATSTPLTIGQELGILGDRHDHVEGHARACTGARGFVHARGDLRRSSPPGASGVLVDRDPARHRTVHERMPGARPTLIGKAWRRHHRHQPLGGRARRHHAARHHGAPRSRSAKSSKRSRFSGGAPDRNPWRGTRGVRASLFRPLSAPAAATHAAAVCRRRDRNCL